MRYVIENNLLDENASRGDFALAVIKDEEVIKICMLNAYTTHDEQTEILKNWKKEKAKIFKVQFLSSNAVSDLYEIQI
jgi:hypothetical protein